jgi:hypothetical protein
MRLGILLTILMLPFAARAEFRVFQLLITDTQSGKARTVTSTLDDLQYGTYRHVAKTETIVIQDTWMCWKRSDHFQELCPNPRPSTSSAQAPAAP